MSSGQPERERLVVDDGQAVMRGLVTIPRDQHWFWTGAWQEGEDEASAAITAGNTTIDQSTEDFLSALDELDAGAK